MKIIALEEHLVTPEIMAAWQNLAPDAQDAAFNLSVQRDIARRLCDLADERIELMDQAGVDVQVLSLTTPGVQSLEPAPAVQFARDINNLIAATVRERPDRFQGFATLPTSAPDEAARELERAVVELGLNGAMLYGRTLERNLDHSDFTPIFETAARLRAPLYIHPQSPTVAVRAAYYQGFNDELDMMFTTAGIGWHYETGIQTLRLILSGAFDRFPDLQIILGHWGEVVLFYLDRIDSLSELAKKAVHLERPISDYFKTNVSVTPGGILSQRYLGWARDALGGTERIMFATDYPFLIETNGGARRFLDAADLSDTERSAIAHGNWERMCAAIRR